MMMPVLIKAKPLKEFARAVVRKVGALPEHAEIIADILVAANLRGVDTHGVMRLPLYIAQMEKGALNTDPQKIRVLAEHPATCLMDGADSPGFVVAFVAMQKAIELAKVTGVGIVGVRNSNHFGAAAYYAMMPLVHEMIGMACTNTRAMLAPFGGAEAGVGNNPLAIAVPAGEFPPVVLDMAMSVAAGGKIHMAAKEGRRIPEGWVVNAQGLPTTDPLDFTDHSRKGCLVPFAGYKGSGMAFIIDLLAGALTGPLFGMAVDSEFSTESPSHMGNTLVAIRIADFVEP
jgi:ureidoglycolate dehydrogenase (NAD+)